MRSELECVLEYHCGCCERCLQDIHGREALNLQSAIPRTAPGGTHSLVFNNAAQLH